MIEISTELLQDLISKYLQKLHVDQEVSHSVARSIVIAHENRHPSHGIQLLTTYENWLKKGILNKTKNIKYVNFTNNVYIYDADKTFGQYVLSSLLKKHLKITDSLGSSMFFVKNMGHLGYIKSVWQGIDLSNYFGFLVSNIEGSKLVIPYGGSTKKLSTMCLSGFCTNDFCFDMTLPSNSENNIKHLLRQNKLLEKPLSLNGTHTLDPKHMYDAENNNPLKSQAGIIFDSHKLFNIGLLIELMCNIFIPSTDKIDRNRFYSNCFVFLIDAKKFNKEVSEDVKAYLSNLKENAVYIANNNKTKNTKVFLHTFEWEILKNLIGESNV